MKEIQNVEFKSNWNDEFLKIIASFANANGGKLYIGVDDNGNVIGLKDLKNLLEILPNKIKNKLQIIAYVNMLKKGDKEYLEIDVKPSSFPVSYNGKFYIRSGSTTHELEGQELCIFSLKNQ
ncbi:MAG: ATP-binding protein, partial [candidate division WOR-3 bacterium]